MSMQDRAKYRHDRLAERSRKDAEARRKGKFKPSRVRSAETVPVSYAGVPESALPQPA